MEFWELVEVVSILGSVIERLLKTIDYTRKEGDDRKSRPRKERKSRLGRVVGLDLK